MDEPSNMLTVRERRNGALIALGFLAMLGYLIASHYHPSAAVIGCPFHSLTGYSCPGCGMTRSTTHFIFGDLAAALRYHPFGPLFVLGFAVMAGHHLVQSLTGKRLSYRALDLWRRVEKPIWVVALVLVGLFGIGRLVGELTGFLTPL